MGIMKACAEGLSMVLKKKARALLLLLLWSVRRLQRHNKSQLRTNHVVR